MAKIVQNRNFSGYLGYGNYFFHCFAFDYGRAWLDSQFGVLHDHIYGSINTWDPKTPQKWPKSSKMGSFLVAMVTKMIIFDFFSFDPNRTWLDGPFGVLHDLLYASIDVKEP